MLCKHAHEALTLHKGCLSWGGAGGTHVLELPWALRGQPPWGKESRGAVWLWARALKCFLVHMGFFNCPFWSLCTSSTGTCNLSKVDPRTN